ncbi:hypothetical protein SDC9_154926 [bioreactor metagenome]|uniref:Uncharacterized protein n=1 Tax=bioreactor metagenome TaxID=1076179 RepID=A0A645F025_9ZZZZ
MLGVVLILTFGGGFLRGFAESEVKHHHIKENRPQQPPESVILFSQIDVHPAGHQQPAKDAHHPDQSIGHSVFADQGTQIFTHRLLRFRRPPASSA